MKKLFNCVVETLFLRTNQNRLQASNSKIILDILSSKPAKSVLKRRILSKKKVQNLQRICINATT